MLTQDIATTKIDNGLTNFLNSLCKLERKDKTKQNNGFQLTRTTWFLFSHYLRFAEDFKCKKTQTWTGQRRATKTLLYNAWWGGFLGKPYVSSQGCAQAYTRIVPAYVMQPNTASTCCNFTLCLWVGNYRLFDLSQ